MTIDRYCLRSLYLLLIITSSNVLIQPLLGQVTVLTGTMTYTQTKVTDIDLAANAITVADPTNFAIDDRVLLIKMQGASINETDDFSFGTIGDLNEVGEYEIARICSILGNRVAFHYNMANSYTGIGPFVGKMQMIKIPQYEDVQIVGTLTAPSWDGDMGGILIFEASGTVEFFGDIDMSGKGFAGGHYTNSSFACKATTNSSDPADNSLKYFYNLASGEGACKGEGISGYVSNKEAGKGRLANGGGGGNNYNAGGGGGANYGTGGNGGSRQATAGDPLSICRGEQPGLPGVSLASMGYSAAENRIFMGGGGGAGHADDDEGSKGGNGGGIVIIRANEIDGRGFSIMANGEAGGDSGSDGAPGGGAGGTVLLDVNTFSPNTLTINVAGGNGGSSNVTGNDCMGPGGGGGGGVVWSKLPLTANVQPLVNGGINGYTAATSGCGGGGIASNGAFPGLSGASVNGLVIPEETVNFTSCVLSAETIELKAKVFPNRVHLSWNPSSPGADVRYTIQRSIDARVFENMEMPQRAASTLGTPSFEYIDRTPYHGTSYYRLKEVDKNGGTNYSAVTEVNLDFSQRLDIEVYPNPTSANQMLTIELPHNEAGAVEIKLNDLQGRMLFTHSAKLQAQRNSLKIRTPELQPGTYFLSARVGDKLSQKKLVVW